MTTNDEAYELERKRFKALIIKDIRDHEDLLIAIGKM